jgi:hypothetical protein
MKTLLIFLAACSLSFAQLVGPKVAVQQLEYDFGKVEQGKVVKHDFTISNNGGDLLVIKKVKASCGCTAAKPIKNELSPGESTEINVEFNTKGRSGVQHKIVYVDTNDPDKPQLELKIFGNIIKAG